jgi:hypothetical protein
MRLEYDGECDQGLIRTKGVIKINTHILSPNKSVRYIITTRNGQIKLGVCLSRNIMTCLADLNSLLGFIRWYAVLE